MTKLPQQGIGGPIQENFDRLTKDRDDLDDRVVVLEAAMTATAARVFNSANISIPNNTFTGLTFDSERSDVGGFHSTSSNTGRFTIPTAGVYAGGANVRFAANATGRRDVTILLNGATTIAYDLRMPVTTDPTDVVVPFQYRFAAGDFIEVFVRQNAGGAINVEVAANYSPEFWIHRIGS